MNHVSWIGLHDYFGVGIPCRCLASCVAVCAAVAFLLQRDSRHLSENGRYNISAICEEAFKLSKRCLVELKSVSLFNDFFGM